MPAPTENSSPCSISRSPKARSADARYRLLPVFSELLKPDPAMQALIEKMRAPYATAYAEKLATADRLLYRRGNFSGTMDQLICDALRGELDAEIALSPGFRWGTTALAGQPLTMEDVFAETAITYPATYVQSMTGGQIKDVLEDVCDNLFNADPYYQQGGDMVRVGGLAYTCTPAESVGKRISELQARQWPARWKPARPTRSRAGPPSTNRTARRYGMWWQSICAPASRRTARLLA